MNNKPEKIDLELAILHAPNNEERRMACAVAAGYGYSAAVIGNNFSSVSLHVTFASALSYRIDQLKKNGQYNEDDIWLGKSGDGILDTLEESLGYDDYEQ